MHIICTDRSDGSLFLNYKYILVPGWCLMGRFDMMIMKMWKCKLYQCSRTTDIRLINLISKRRKFQKEQRFIQVEVGKGYRRKAKVPKAKMNRTLNTSCLQELSFRQKVFIFENVQSSVYSFRHCLYPKAELFEWFDYIHIEYLIINNLGIESSNHNSIKSYLPNQFFKCQLLPNVPNKIFSR